MTTVPPREGPDWESTALFRELGLRVEVVGEGYARLAVRRDGVRLRGARDGLNGGIVATLGEAAMHVCLASMLAEGERAGRTRELTVAFLSGARGEVTLVEARMLRKGGRLAVGDIELRDGGSGALNAKLRVTCEVTPAPTMH